MLRSRQGTHFDNTAIHLGGLPAVAMISKYWQDGRGLPVWRAVMGHML